MLKINDKSIEEINKFIEEFNIFSATFPETVELMTIKETVNMLLTLLIETNLKLNALYAEIAWMEKKK